MIMNWKTKEKRINLFALGLLIFAELFYLFFAIYDGVDLSADSYTYISMDVAREPIYSLFLALIRLIVQNEETSLFVAVILQSLLAGFAGWMLAFYLSGLLRLSKLETLVIYLFPIMVSLLCRYGAQRAAMYSNSILTEGITLSLYLIFFRYLLEYVVENNKKSFVICLVLSVLMTATRKQMMLTLGMLVFSVLLVTLQKRTLKKGILTIIISSVLVLVLSSGIDYVYNYSVRGIWAKHSSDTRFLTTMGYYIADVEDVEKIEDTKIRNLTREIYTICSEKGYTRAAAEGSWSERIDHFMNHYDLIQISTMWPMVQTYVIEQEKTESERANYRADEILGIMNRALLYPNLSSAFLVFCDNFRYGMVTTIAQKHPLLNWYTILAYICYLALLLYRIFSLKKHPDENAKVRVLLGVLTLVSILMNVGLVSMVIFCQPRYTIYNMSLFYIAGFLLLSKKAPGSEHGTK